VLLTQKLLWIVVRSANSVIGLDGAKVYVNSLGFAGTLMVKD